jgi:mRNA interferase MazF
MKRGDLVVAVLPGEYGKPRPALVIQSDLFDRHPSVTLLPISSDPKEAPFVRIFVNPDAANGLQQRSQIMADKAITVPRKRIGKVIGRLDPDDMLAVSRALALFLGFA